MMLDCRANISLISIMLRTKNIKKHPNMDKTTIRRQPESPSTSNTTFKVLWTYKTYHTINYSSSL